MKAFNKVKKIKKLGSGMLGTAYLVNYKNKTFINLFVH